MNKGTTIARRFNSNDSKTFSSTIETGLDINSIRFSVLQI